MNQTKFKVDILANGSENENILKAIAHHNEGKAIISLPDLISWGVMKTAVYPSVVVSVERSDDIKNMLIVTDNGKRTLTIQEIEVFELVDMVESPDDLKDIF